MIERPILSADDLEFARRTSIAAFRRERMEEPLENYLEAFDEYRGETEDLLETSVDLVQLEQQALAIISDSRLLHALRYVTGPPISVDDLKTLTENPSLVPSVLKKDAARVRRIIEAVLIGLDRRRFPWITEGREPTEAERHAAILASAALMATQHVGTKRRGEAKTEQENKVEAALIAANWKKVPTRVVQTLDDAPAPGEFCRESMLGTRKADFVTRLWDRRVMPLECKVSNSATNSIKRLNNDAAVKATVWVDEFGNRQVVPAAVLAGVYKLHNLQNAQERGLAIFWAHDLGRLVEWIESTGR